MEFHLGWIAVLLFALGGMFRFPVYSITVYTLGNFVYIFHYVSIDLMNPAISMACATCCTLLMLIAPKKHLNHCVALTLIVLTVSILENYSSAVDSCILLAGWAIVFANYNRTQYIPHKLGTIVSQLLWCIYTVYYSDYPMLIACSCIAVTNLYSLLFNLHKDRALKAVSVSTSRSRNLCGSPKVAAFIPVVKSRD